MARIRSIHPGLFTDEAFVSLSPAAQVLWIGLWCEADDQGVFEWKPTMLKMRILPASTAPIEPLLTELERANCVQAYTVEGRHYGVIRNFVRHQRPKKPKEVHPLPPALRNYAGFEPTGTRPNATTGRKRYDAGSEQPPPSAADAFGTEDAFEAAEPVGHSEQALDEDASVRNEFGTSSKPVPNLALRWRMEDEGCSSPSRERTFQDGERVTPSPAHTHVGAHPRGAPPRTHGLGPPDPHARLVAVGGAR